jgi:hypothetical protein
VCQAVIDAGDDAYAARSDAEDAEDADSQDFAPTWDQAAETQAIFLALARDLDAYVFRLTIELLSAEPDAQDNRARCWAIEHGLVDPDLPPIPQRASHEPGPHPPRISAEPDQALAPPAPLAAPLSVGELVAL